MAITVRDITDEPTLGTRLVAGGAGHETTVQWATTCEMDKPWEWLDAGDMLLVNGHRLPADPDAQAAFVNSLSSSGMSALGVAEHAFAPELSEQMLAMADTLGFPLLRIDYQVAFVSISKHVASSNTTSDHRNLRLVSRIYDRAKHSSESKRPFRESLELLGELVESRLSVTTPLGLSLLGTEELAPDTQAELASEEGRRRGHPLPAAIRLTSARPGTLALPVPATRPALLVVEPKGRPCDGAVLTHIVLLVALELEREETRDALSASVLSDVLSGLVGRRSDTAVAAQSMRMLGFDPDGDLIIAATEMDDGFDFVRTLLDQRVPHLNYKNQAISLVLLEHTVRSLQLLRSVGVNCPIGLSAPFVGLGRVPDAAAEAVFARGIDGRPGVAEYGDRVDFLQPRSLAEAQRLVDRVLGPLIELDRETGGVWIVTLRTFLAMNRSWKRCSEELHLHKQSLVYRIKRIERVLDRSLDSIESLAEVWLALKAMDLLTDTEGDGETLTH